jgi:uncharacterized protein YkwD
MATLFSNTCLQPGQSIQSNNKLHTLVLQTDGNVILYNNQNKALWTTNTAGVQPRDLFMQPDGDLVLYDTSGTSRWCSQTSNNPGAFLNIQDDGNLVIYRVGSQTETAENALWATGSNDMATQVPTQAPTQGGQGESDDPIQKMLNLVNQLRQDHGAPSLSLNAQLTASAQGHSQDMANRNVIDHMGSDGSSPFDRMVQAGYPGNTSRAENIAQGAPTPEDAMAEFVNEALDGNGRQPHVDNMLNPVYRAIGIGYASGFWTQDFGSA